MGTDGCRFSLVCSVCQRTRQLYVVTEVLINSNLFVFLPSQPIVVVLSQPASGLQSPRFRGFVITHNDALQSVGLPWTSDQSVAETST